ncbi:hypothetical protein [Gordonia hongkongensis]|uniref:hypothetical protein n=1 Tax=Gordonia hongkongensis TaxID=1701090 RepID=UPI00300DFD59
MFRGAPSASSTNSATRPTAPASNAATNFRRHVRPTAIAVAATAISTTTKPAASDVPPMISTTARTGGGKMSTNSSHTHR